MTSLVLLLLGINTGGNQLPWTHPLVLTALPLSLVVLFVFIWVEERYASEPVIPVRLLLKRTVWGACLANWFSSMVVFTAFFYVPYYLQVRGYSATQAGLRLIPNAVGSSIGSLGAGYLMRLTGRYYLLLCGCMACLLLGSAFYLTFTLDTPDWATYLYVLPQGIGYGGMLTITLVGLISAVDHQDQALITSASYAFRSTGSTIGITIGSAIFQNMLTRYLWDTFGDRKDAGEIIRKIRDSLSYMNHLPSGWSKADVLDCYMGALRLVFLSGLALSCFATISGLFMREHTLFSNLARRPSDTSR